MGFRFHRRIKILPGVTINLSKGGISTSFGPRGAKVTLGKDGVRTTVGLPGTGLSYTKYKRYKDKDGVQKSTGRGYVSTCPYCGHNMRKQWDNCPKCGRSLTEMPAQPPPDRVETSGLPAFTTCPRCGEAWDQTAKVNFCPNCGYRFTAEATGSPAVPTTEASHPTDKETSLKSWLPWLILLVVLLLLLMWLVR